MGFLVSQILVGEVLVGAVLVGEEVGVLVREVGGVFIRDFDGDLGGEFDGGEAGGVLEGKASGDGTSSSMVVGLIGGKSSTTFGSSWLLVSIFCRSNRTIFGFFVDEVDSISESLYAFAIPCHACSMATSHSNPRNKNLDLFLFVVMVLVSWEFDHILKALWITFFCSQGCSKSSSMIPLKRKSMSSSVDSLDVSPSFSTGFFSGVDVMVCYASDTKGCICNSTSC